MEESDAFVVEGCRALVTGVNRPRGIGRALADALLARGARQVIATARQVEQLADWKTAYGSRVEAVSLDVRDHEGVARLAASLVDLDLVISNAGVFLPGPVLGTADDAETGRMEMEVNYLGPLALARAFVPHLIQRSRLSHRRPAFVLVNSIAGLMSFPQAGTYSASKAAAHFLTQALRREHPELFVMGVYPGPVDTEMPGETRVPKVPASLVARAVVAGLEAGETWVFPDPLAQRLRKMWREDPEQLELHLARLMKSR